MGGKSLPKRRRLFPLPIENIIDDPIISTFHPAVFGMLCKIILHYWHTECAPLPTRSTDLCALARGHIPTWCRWQVEIMAAFERVRPSLDSYLIARQTKSTTIKHLQRHAVARSKAARLERSQRAQLALAAGAPMIAHKINATSPPPSLAPDTSPHWLVD